MLLAQLVLAEAEQTTSGAGPGGAAFLSSEDRLRVLAAMGMCREETNEEAHAVAAMGLATMCNAPSLSLSLVAKVALPALVRLGHSRAPDTACAALDALAVLAEQPQVQVDLVRMGALKLLLERAGSRADADIRALALSALQNVASNGANMGALIGAETQLRAIASSHGGDIGVGRAIETVLRSVATISTLLELQSKARPLRPGEVGAMLDCVRIAGVDASISREVAHTCAAIGAAKRNAELFVEEGGLELLNRLARSHALPVQVEVAAALVAFGAMREEHRELVTQGCVDSLVFMARSQSEELLLNVARAFAALAESNAPRAALAQSGALPHLFRMAMKGTHPEIQYNAAKTILYLR